MYILTDDQNNLLEADYSIMELMGTGVALSPYPDHAELASHNVYVTEYEALSPTSTQKVTWNETPTLANSVWTVSGTIVDKTQAEIDADLDANNAQTAMLAAVIRQERDGLIAATDTWALSDRTMTAEQTAYRQALRDVTGQAGFPANITWPTKP